MQDFGSVSFALKGLSDAIQPYPIWSLALLFILLLAQGLILFFDGRRHGIRFYWLWALWGLTTCPMPSILYWFLVRQKHKR